MSNNNSLFPKQASISVYLHYMYININYHEESTALHNHFGAYPINNDNSATLIIRTIITTITYNNNDDSWNFT